MRRIKMKRTALFSMLTVFLLISLTGCPVGEVLPAGNARLSLPPPFILPLAGTLPDKNEHAQFTGTLSGDLSGRYFVIQHRDSGKYLINYYGELKLKNWHDVATNDAGQGLWKFSRSRKYSKANNYPHDYYKIVSYRGGSITANIPNFTLRLDGTGGTSVCWWIHDRENDGTYLLRSLKDTGYRMYSGSPYTSVGLSENSRSGKLFLIAQQDMTTFWGTGSNYIPVTVK